MGIGPQDKGFTDFSSEGIKISVKRTYKALLSIGPQD